jgi:bifunctional ADP-heptose synthase (sugar kinase/adenylyltransferase)
VIILRLEAQRDVPGGAANALANLAALDVRTLSVGVVGDDEPGGALLDALVERGVDTSAVVRVAGYQTPTKVRILGGGPGSLKHQVARYDIEDRLPAGGPWLGQLLDRIDRLLPEAQAVALSDYGYGTVADEALQRLVAGGRRPRWTCADSRSRIAELAGVDGVTNLRESRPPSRS